MNGKADEFLLPISWERRLSNAGLTKRSRAQGLIFQRLDLTRLTHASDVCHSKTLSFERGCGETSFGVVFAKLYDELADALRLSKEIKHLKCQ